MILLTALAVSSASVHAADEKLPISLNLGLSGYTASGLDANVELPLTRHFSAMLGTGHYGGYSVGAKLYRDISNDGPYFGLGYGVVELEETYIEEDSSWKEDLEYGSFLWLVIGF